MTEVVCELRGVTKAYGDRVVLDRLDLAVSAGEMVALTGASGSGKSTILNIMGLLERPDTGTVRLFGVPAPRSGSQGAMRLLRNRLGYLFQNYALIDDHTVEQNLRVAQTYVSGTTAKRRAALAHALERVGLAGTERKKIYQLSGGEQQRVAIARAMLKPCDLILADEPTGSLDAGNRDEVLTLLQDMNAGGKTVVVVTHDPGVARACTREVGLGAPRLA